jgi:titin
MGFFRQLRSRQQGRKAIKSHSWLVVEEMENRLVPSSFIGQSAAVFLNPLLEAHAVVTGIGTSSFSFGRAVPGHVPDSLSYTGARFDAAPDQEFSLATLSFTDGLFYDGTGADGVDLATTVDVSSPPSNPVTFNLPLTIIFEPVGAGIGDNVTLPLPLFTPDVLTTPDGTRYFLQIVGFGNFGGGGSGTPSQFFSNPALDSTATADLLARFTATPPSLVVTSLADPTDSDPTKTTLRQAIEYANSQGGGTISFDIAGGGPQTIHLTSPLPAITSSLVIDGTSQPGFAGTPIIELDGSAAGPGDGLDVRASNCTIKGLVIDGFAGFGIDISGNGTNNNWVTGNYIGTNFAGNVALGNAGGVAIHGGAQLNIIGTNGDGVNDNAEGNVISGNGSDTVFIIEGLSVPGGDNVDIYGLGTAYNIVAGNFIGTDVTGTVAVPGVDQGGVGIYLSAQHNRIGVDPSDPGGGAERNVISGNFGNAVLMFGSGVNYNRVSGNFIGTDLTGTAPLPNGFPTTIAGASYNIIGGTSAAERNVISGNQRYGVRVRDEIPNDLGLGVSAPAIGNQILGNYIGVDVSGLNPLPNGTGSPGDLAGIQVRSISSPVTGTIIGEPGAGNVISANAGNGITIDGTNATGTIVQANYIGTDVSGTLALPNNGPGVGISNGAANNIIGTNADGVSDSAERNIISGNSGAGVALIGAGTDHNSVAGNFIGTDATGMTALPNAGNGVRIVSGASSNVIGGTSVAARNVISGNGGSGVRLREFVGDSVPTADNQVLGNFIGVDATGTHPLGNALGGITIFNDVQIGVTGTIIGAPGAGNVVAGNSLFGIYLQGGGPIGTVVQSNYIGTDVGSTLILPNGGPGVAFFGASDNVVNANVIAFNAAAGVDVGDPTSIGNSIRANSIYANATLGIELDGGNNSQSHPEVTFVQTGAITHVQGTLDSQPNMSFLVDFYASPSPDALMHGWGERYLGFAVVTTNAAGHASFDVFLGPTAPGEIITTTATDPIGDTSQFSDNVPTAITLTAPGVIFGTDALVTVAVANTETSATPTGNVSLTVDGTSYSSTLNGGTAPFDVGILNAGDHSLAAAYATQDIFAPSAVTGTLHVDQATPTVQVTDAGGTYNGSAFPATATVTGVNQIAAASLENVTPTLTYYLGSATGGTPLSGAPFLPGTYTVVAAFAGSQDYKSASATATFTITVPTTSISGATIGVPGQPLTYAFSVLGPTQGITFSINYGDGSSLNTSAGGPSVKLDHIYAAAGSFTIQVTATDTNGVVSQLATQQVQISTVAMEADAGGGTALAVGGNAAGGDRIDVSATDTTGKAVNVTINGISLGTFTPTGHILVYGQGGKDKILLKPYVVGNNTYYYIQVPALLYGEGTGGDKISAGGSAANNVLTGSGTNEVLTGGQGRDLLIGGTGPATLNAGVLDDILIGGWTNYDISSAGMTYDQKFAALNAIMNEWGSADSYLARLNVLASYLNTNTVHDNYVNGVAGVDQLLGNAKANDWFFAGLNDHVTGTNENDVITTIK